MSADRLVEWIKQVERWLLDRRPELTGLEANYDLIENRILDSLAFLSFINFIQELTGQELNVDAHSANSFRTLQLIRDAILAPISSGEANA
jgi:hypothetical protein